MVTVSMGLTCFPEGGKDVASLIKTAEQALVVAKFEGRDRVIVAEAGPTQTSPIPWSQLAEQAKLAVLSERQSKLQNRLTAEYSPWMRNVPSWGIKKKTDS